MLYWLSGLTCTDENFIVKSGAQRAASNFGIALIAPDTSPSESSTAPMSNQLAPSVNELFLSQSMVCLIDHSPAVSYLLNFGEILCPCGNVSSKLYTQIFRSLFGEQFGFPVAYLLSSFLCSLHCSKLKTSGCDFNVKL